MALGAQDFFKNLISGLVVLSERRYRTGDRVQLSGVVDGSVERIGFRSTRVRLFDGAPVSVPNAMLADGALVNYGEIPWRRVLWTINLEYGTTSEQLILIRDRIQEYLRESGDFAPAGEATQEVRLDKFAESSIDIMIYAFANTNEWVPWLATKERLLIRVKEIVEEAGAGFAFPSRSIYVERGGFTPGERVSARILRRLDEVAEGFDGILCDVWGVYHDGVRVFPSASEALARYRRSGGAVVMLTNAPRPSAEVVQAIRRLGGSEADYDAIVTSGDAARSFLAEGTWGHRAYHLGPPRDLPLVRGIALELVPFEAAEFILCTGLFDDRSEGPEDYDSLLREASGKGGFPCFAPIPTGISISEICAYRAPVRSRSRTSRSEVG